MYSLDEIEIKASRHKKKSILFYLFTFTPEVTPENRSKIKNAQSCI